MKNVIVTGANGNIGRVVVQKFIDEGYHVIGTLTPADAANFEFTHPNFEHVVIDLLDESAVSGFIAALVARLVTIDAVVLTVGGFAMGDIGNTSLQDVSRQVRLNFETTYSVAKPVFLHMMEKGRGRIFLFGAKPGISGQGHGMTAYSLAKSLVFKLADLMNQEAAGTNVVTTVIVPGTIDTPANRAAMPNADRSTWVSPASIADLITFYCAEPAASIREPILKVYGNSK